MAPQSVQSTSAPTGTVAPPLKRPTAAFVLSLIGGIIILLWGASLATVGVSVQIITFGFLGTLITLLGTLEAVLGLLVIVFGVLMFVRPKQHATFGVLVLVCSVVSLIGLGGLFLGFVLGLVGGILGIVHKPGPAA